MHMAVYKYNMYGGVANCAEQNRMCQGLSGPSGVEDWECGNIVCTSYSPSGRMNRMM